MSSKSPCQQAACAIQTCLAQHNHDESKCTRIIDNLYACCQSFYEKQGQDSSNPNCPKFNVLMRKIDQRSRESIDAKLVR